jgi:hypothetical protein
MSDIPENFITEPKDLNAIMAVMLKTLLVDKLGPERLKSGGGAFSYVVSMDNTIENIEETFMLSFDNDGRFLMEKVDKGLFPEHCVLFFSEDKESAIMNAAMHGDEFIIDDEYMEEGPGTTVDPNDHFSDPELP